MLFLKIYLMIFLAELGDKTQLAALTLSAQRPKAKWIIFAGSALALVLSSLVAVIGGDLISRIPNSQEVIKFVVAAVFLFFGVTTLMEARRCGSGEESGECACSCTQTGLWAIFLRVLVMIFLAELGDKTQLAALSASANDPASKWLIFSASSAALASTSLLAVVIGDRLARIPNSSRYIGYIAGIVFIIYGMITLWDAISKYL